MGFSPPATKNLYKSSFQISLLHSSSSQTPQNSIKAAIKSKTYNQIPYLLKSQQQSNNNDPFSFLAFFPKPLRTQIIDQILQSLIPFRPQSHLKLTYSHLLSHTLQTPKPLLPIALAVLQRTLRSGLAPSPDTHLSLSSVWADSRRRRRPSVSVVLSEMASIGYPPDSGTCNYLIMSLCKTSRLDESINVLKGMNGTGLGCLPNSESYGVVIGAMCGERRTKEAMWLMREMVRVGVMPRQGTVCRVVAALRRDKEIRRATEMVEMLERKGVSVGFEGYEILVEGCLERREFVLAGKVVMDMVERKGFVPYIGVRQRVVKGLVGIGKADFASVVRQKLVGVLS